MINNLQNGKLLHGSRFSKINLSIFALVFAGLGGYFMLFSNAANITGDVNSDGVVDTTDLSLLLSNYNTNYLAAEFDGGPIVEAHDLALLLAHWGQSAAPTNTVLPSISGTPTQGQTLSTTNGTWTNNPTSYSYQWQDCDSSGNNCSNITTNATNSTYVLVSTDVNNTIRVVVTATNAGGSTLATSNQTAVVDAPSGYAFADEFNGSAVDQTQWDVMNQQGDTSNNEKECYEPSQTAVSGGYLTETAIYVSGGFTCPAGTPGSNNPLHYLSGAVQMKSASFTYGTIVFRAKFPGAARTTWPAIWMLGAACQQPNWLTGAGFNCPWPQDNLDTAEIDVAEGNSGSVTTMLENLYNNNSSGGGACGASLNDYSNSYHTYEMDWTPGSLVFKIDGTNTSCHFSGSVVPSHPMFLIINSAIQTGSPVSGDLPQTMNVDYVHITSSTMPTNTSTPTITGTAQQGQTLTAHNGSWTNNPTSYTYQWQRDGTTDISGATNSTYVPTSADVGHTLNVIVTAKNSTGAGAQNSVGTSGVM